MDIFYINLDTEIYMEYVNIIKNGTEKIVHVTAVYSAFGKVNLPDFYFRGESHDFWEVVYIVGGKALITADSRIYNLEKGDMVFHKPMEFHKIASSGGENLEVVIFSFSVTGDMSYFNNAIFKATPEQQKLILSIPELLAKKQENIIFEQLLVNTIERFLIMLKLNSKAVSKLDGSGSAIEFRKIVSLMNKHIYENITVDGLADMCGLSTANMKKIFRKYTGMGIIKYFNGLKMNCAAKMIEQGLAITEISEKLSFDNQNYFSTVFKREMGLSPRAYREKINKESMF